MAILFILVLGLVSSSLLSSSSSLNHYAEIFVFRLVTALLATAFIELRC